MKSFFIQEAQKLHNTLVQWRRDFHQYPELSFEEYRTAQKIETLLRSWGYNPFRMASTGVIAYLGKGTKTLALRADIDALPIQEQNEVPYRSKHPGIMHACGHDVHSACLLGVAYILKKVEQQLQGRIKFIFQPGEERLPGGASLLIKEGVLEDVDAIIGQHTMPLLAVGEVGIRSGMYMASTDELYITLRGKGGHGAQPHSVVDPVVVAAEVLLALQQVVSRKADPRVPTVLSFGAIKAEGATNVIPSEVTMQGTFRTFDEAWRTKAHEWIKKIVQHQAQSFDVEATIEIKRGYPVLYNHPQLTQQVRQHLIEYLGAEHVHDLPLWTASEDFAFYTQHIPGCFYRLGTANERLTAHLHSPYFDVDERALSVGTGALAYVAFSLLQKPSQLPT